MRDLKAELPVGAPADEEAGRSVAGAGRGRVVFVTGAPGAGKTRVCQRVAELSRHKGLRVSGLVTEARRLASGRAVQTVVNLRTGERRRLADYVGVDEGEPIGRGLAGRFSWTFVSESVRWGRHELDRCLTKSTDVLIIDQLGPLELMAGSGWSNGVEVLRGGRFGVAVVAVNPMVLGELRRRVGDAAAVDVDVNAATCGLLPEYLAGLAAGRPVADGPLLASGGPDALVSDVDGTLLGLGAASPDPAIGAGVREIERAGAMIVVCTGRPTERALRFAKDLGLRHGFIISYGGAETRDLGTGEALGRVALSAEAGAEVTRLARALRLDLSAHDSPAGTLRLVLAGGGRQIERAERALSESLGAAIRTSSPEPGILAVQAGAATKLDALTALLRRAGVDRSAVAYLGDAADDAPALAWAGLGVAVTGRSAEAAAAADVVATPERLPDLLVQLALARRFRPPAGS